MKTFQFAALLLLPLCAACVAVDSNPSRDHATLTCREGARPMAQVELLFGTGRRGTSLVSEREWSAFLDEEITPRFPEGLTVLSGYGQWRGQSGTISKERSIVLVIWYEPNQSREAAIEAIRLAYKERFAQESVMRVDGLSCVSF